MKNQYYGDVNDFREYGLMRTLARKGEIKTGVCWMLTPEDGRTDGKFLSYLQQPQKWRSYDTELFDTLYQHIFVEEVRSLNQIESSNLLPATKFHSEILEDNIQKRKKYFEVMSSKFSKVDLLFFDPDNGFEIHSIPLGRTRRNGAYTTMFHKINHTRGVPVLIIGAIFHNHIYHFGM